MSGTQVSSFAPANDLFDLQKVYQGAQQYQQNQQTLGSNEIEMLARASAGLLNLPTEEARAAAYPQAVQQLRQYGFAKNAPEAYPGEARLKQIALLGTSSSTQAEWQSNIAANTAIAAAGRTGTGTGTTAGTTVTTPATGTGTVAAQPVEPDALTRAQAVRDGLIKRGLDPDTATAFASNALHESAARPDTGAGDAGASHGVFQWQGPRYEGYKSVFGNAPDNAPLDQQLDYVMHELNTTESAAREQIAAAKTPEEKAAAISQYYLRPKDTEPEKQRRAATARQLVSQWGGSGQPATTYVGDSLVEPGGVGGQTGRGVRGASPDAVLARLRDPNATSDAQIRGKHIVLSSGASNDPEHAQLLASQLQTLKDRGAGAVTVLGVGPGVKGADTVNAQLKEIAERNGARFVALPADQMGKDGVHPTKEGYAALQAQVQAAPAQAAPGGPQQPGPYKVAGAVVAPPAGTPGAPAATPQNALAPGASGAPATAGAVAPVAQNQVGPQVAPAPAAPRLALNGNGLTTQQQATVDALGGTGRFTGQQRVALEEQYRQHNIAQQTAAQTQQHQQQTAALAQQAEQRQQAAAEETRRQHQIENERAAASAAALAAQRRIENELANASAAALAEQRRIENARAGVPTGSQRNPETGVIEPIPGYRGATADERIEYDLKHADPSSRDYAEAWKAKKWQTAPNGAVIENDMSGYAAPTRSVQRPTFLPQPTGTALDEVRKVDTDARVIVPAIDRYADLHKEIGGSGWGAYFDDPTNPKAQQLIGAFNVMKTALRSPAYANTGVLQPAEMAMLKQELVSPQTIRGLYATPQALEARLHEIKFAILSRQDAELRSVGKDGVIVRDKSDYAKIPDGGKYYDEDGSLKVKRKAE